MSSIKHIEGSAITIRNLSHCEPGQLVRTRKTSPSEYILVLARGTFVTNHAGNTTTLYGVDLQTGEPVLFDHQVFILPDGDQIVLSNGDEQ